MKPWPSYLTVKLSIIGLSIISLSAGILSKPALSYEEPTVAQTIQRMCATPQPANDPLNIEYLLPDAPPPPTGIITNQTISQYGLTSPSLWLADEIYGGKLLDSWLAYPKAENLPGRIDLVVNRQFWSLLNYLERYQFVNEFGMVAQDYGYNMRVFNPQGNFLAAYTCAENLTSCRICLDAGPTGVRGN
jgi:hypothetical protein